MVVCRTVALPVAGFSDEALAYLLHLLSASHAQEAGLGLAAARHGGCRSTLECLKLGPPADQPHLSDASGKCEASIMQLRNHGPGSLCPAGSSPLSRPC